MPGTVLILFIDSFLLFFSLKTKATVPKTHYFVASHSQPMQTVESTYTLSGYVSTPAESPLSRNPSVSSDLLRAKDSGLERLLKDSQAQVRQLLPAREESFRLSTELQIQKDIIATKEEENRRLQQMLLEERAERTQWNRKTHDAHVAAMNTLQDRCRQLEDENSELQVKIQSLQRDLERKARQQQSLEHEIQTLQTAKNEDRSKASEKDTLLTTVEAERNRAVHQSEEFARQSAKLEQAKKALEQQLSTARQDADNARAEAETLRRQKTDLSVQLTQAQCQRDALEHRSGLLQDEAKQVGQLRVALGSLESVREESAALRDSIEKSESAVNNERCARRSAEAERDQLLLKLRGMEMDLRRVEAECHRVQCEAAERVPLRRENDDLKATLHQCEKRTQGLQEELSSERVQRANEKRLAELLLSVLSGELTALRNALTSRNADALRLSALQADDQRSLTEDVSGLVIDPPASSSAHDGQDRRHASALVSPIQHEPSGVSTVFSKRDDPTPAVGRREVLSQVNSLLDSLRTAVVDAIHSTSEEVTRRSSINKLLDAEQRKNSELESGHRRLQQDVMRLQMDLAALTSREQDLSRQMRSKDESHHRVVLQVKQFLHQLRLALDIETLGNVDYVTSDPDEMLDTQHIVERVTALVRDCAFEARQKRELAEEVERCHALHTAVLRSHDERVVEMERRAAVQMNELVKTTEAQLRESSRHQEDLSSAVRVAVERFERLSDDHQHTQQKLTDSLQECTRLEAVVQDLKRELERRRTEIASQQIAIEKYNLACSEHQDIILRLQEDVHVLRDREAATQKQHAEEKLRGDAAVKSVVLLGRYILGLRDTIMRLTVERSWMGQYAQMLESSVHSLVAEGPEPLPNVPLHSTRRHCICPKLIRYTSLRPVVIAVLAAKRIQAMYFALKSRTDTRMSRRVFVRLHTSSVTQTNASHGSSHRFCRVQLPEVDEITSKIVAAAIAQSASHTRDAEHQERSEPSSPSRKGMVVVHPATSSDVEVAQSLVTILSSHVTRHNGNGGLSYRPSFDLLWSLASGLSSSRNVLTLGVFGQVRLAGVTLRQLLRSAQDNASLSERNIFALQRENKSLLEMIDLKEQQCQVLSHELHQAQLLASNMVERKQHSILQKSFEETRASLDLEKDKTRTLEYQLQTLKNDEVQLLLRQTELQNESRMLAIELARKTAQVAVASSAVPAARSATVTPLTPAHFDQARRISPTRPAPARGTTAPDRSPSPRHSSGAVHSLVHLYSKPNDTPRPPVNVAQGRDMGPTHSRDVLSLISSIDEKISSALQYR